MLADTSSLTLQQVFLALYIEIARRFMTWCDNISYFERPYLSLSLNIIFIKCNGSKSLSPVQHICCLTSSTSPVSCHNLPQSHTPTPDHMKLK